VSLPPPVVYFLPGSPSTSGPLSRLATNGEKQNYVASGVSPYIIRGHSTVHRLATNHIPYMTKLACKHQ
jgi:hypothetical protein